MASSSNPPGRESTRSISPPDSPRSARIVISELDINREIPPFPSTYLLPPVDDKIGSGRVLVVGPSGSGKSYITKAILYAKQGMIPSASVMSGTEDVNHWYKTFIPDIFIHDKYDEHVIKNVINRQKTAINSRIENPWNVLIIDDCMDDTKVFKMPVQKELFKNSRHYKMLYILSMQYMMDIPPDCRGNITGVFLLNFPNRKDREKIYNHYAGCIPTFELFCKLMDTLCVDHCAIYIKTSNQSARWEENVFWFRAKSVPSEFKFGCEDYWMYHKDRYDGGRRSGGMIG